MDNNQQKNNPKPIKGRPQKKDELKDAYRVNEKITAKEVRLVGDNVEQGVYSIYDARAIAEEQELDLVEISPNAAPPVCRVIDFQKFLYQQIKHKRIFGKRKMPTLHFFQFRVGKAGKVNIRLFQGRYPIALSLYKQHPITHLRCK